MDTGPGPVVVRLETVVVLEEAVAVTMAEVEVLVTLVDLVRVARTALLGGMFPRLFFFLSVVKNVDLSLVPIKR